MATVFLHQGKERAARQRHPWIFSGAVARVQGYVGQGDAVEAWGADAVLSDPADLLQWLSLA